MGFPVQHMKRAVKRMAEDLCCEKDLVL
jgi:hypothetical protein